MNIYVITCFLSGSDKEVSYFIFDNEDSFNDYIAKVMDLDSDEEPNENFEIANNLREFVSMTKGRTIVREAIYDVVEVEVEVLE